jgi:hypothetical protein
MPQAFAGVKWRVPKDQVWYVHGTHMCGGPIITKSDGSNGGIVVGNPACFGCKVSLRVSRGSLNYDTPLGPGTTIEGRMQPNGMRWYINQGKP